MKTKLSSKHIFFTLCILVGFTLLYGGSSANSEGTNTVTANGKNIEAVTTFEGTATHFTGRGNDKFSVGYYVKDGAVIDKYSLLADKDTPVSKLGLDLVANGEAFNAVIATGKGTDLTLTGSIKASDNGDGKNVSDFSGLGVMIVAADYARVHVNSMKIDTKGFMRGAVITDNHANLIIKDSTFTTMGANPLTQAYKEYFNSANQSIMISPPWVLGIQGGIRGGTMLGSNSTLTVIGSKIVSGAWAVLTTDDCTNPLMNVVDSELEILPASRGGMSSGKFSYSSKYGSGYGTFLIGSARENFYGATFKGVTYAAILMGGDAYYRSSSGKLDLKDADGKAVETVAGKGKPTIINSVFGFHLEGMTGSVSVNLLDGTIVNSEEAVFLHKAGGANLVADNAVLNSAAGIILQMMDNDDSTIGQGAKGFNTEFKEAAGWPSENGNVTKAGAAAGGMPGGMPSGGMPGAAAGGQPAGMPSGGMPGAAAGGQPGGMPSGGMPAGTPSGGMPAGFGGGASEGVKLILTNGNYKGDVFNGSGYYTQSGNALDVSIGKGATLAGAISLTETRHVDESGKQNTHFTINEYYYVGHVANRNYRNGTGAISVNLKDGGKWIVTGESLISKLVVSNGTVEGVNGKKVVMKIDGKEAPIKSGETYSGDIVISIAK
jgi:hypothetical protein